MDPTQLMLLASGAAYSIDPETGVYDGGNLYAAALKFTQPPTAVSARIVSANPERDSDKALINACLIGTTATAVIVAFRGTLPPETNDGVLDWMEDLLAEPVAFPHMPGKVHDGFFAAVMLLFRPIVAAIGEQGGGSGRPVYVTGHSKGGGMAPLFAYKLHQHGLTPAHVTTFAAPESGDAAFKSAYEAVIPNHVRYENYGDLVPFLPPDAEVVDVIAAAAAYLSEDLAWLIRKAASWGYVTVGTERFIMSDDRIIADEPPLDQAADVGINIASTIEGGGTVLEALSSAHTIQVKHGYMTAICPGVSADDRVSPAACATQAR